jgi:hypothetical protein
MTARLPAAAAGLAAFIVTFAAPPLALACPTCATRSGPGLGVFLMIAGLVAVPYGVAAVAIRLVRQIDRSDHPHPLPTDGKESGA